MCVCVHHGTKCGEGCLLVHCLLAKSKSSPSSVNWVSKEGNGEKGAALIGRNLFVLQNKTLTSLNWES